DAVAAARTPKRKLVDPDFPRSLPTFVADERDEPQFRALALANYIAKVWRYWLLTDEQRGRRTIDARTGEPPGSRPAGLDGPDLAPLPTTFAALVNAEPVRPGRAAPC